MRRGLDFDRGWGSRAMKQNNDIFSDAGDGGKSLAPENEASGSSNNFSRPQDTMGTSEGTKEECRSTSWGSYGNVTGAFSVKVSYIYQVQTTQLAAMALEPSLKPLEKALTNYLGPHVVQCGSSSSGLDHKNIFSSKSKSLATGMSANPVDQALSGVNGIACQTSLVPGAERCFLVGGVFTLFGDVRLENFESEFQEMTKLAFQDGFLNRVDEHIVDVQFVRLVSSALEGEDPSEWLPTFVPTQTPPENPTEEPVLDEIEKQGQRVRIDTESWFYPVLGVLLGMCALGLLAYRRWRRRRLSGKFDMGFFPEDTDDENSQGVAAAGSSFHSIGTPYHSDDEDDVVVSDGSTSGFFDDASSDSHYLTNPYLKQGIQQPASTSSPRHKGYGGELGIL